MDFDLIYRNSGDNRLVRLYIGSFLGYSDDLSKIWQVLKKQWMT